MPDNVKHNLSTRQSASRRGLDGSPLVKWTLISIGLAFALLFLLLPLMTVFYEALAGGVSFYLKSLAQPDSLSAIRLTLIIAAIAVPLNLVFGLAARQIHSNYAH
jgi:sulfate transport system permease protein